MKALLFMSAGVKWQMKPNNKKREPAKSTPHFRFNSLKFVVVAD